MSPLSARTQALLEAARREATPPDEAVRRVRARLHERLPTEAAVVAAPALLGKAATLLGLVFIGALGGVAFERLTHPRPVPLLSIAPAPSCPPLSAAPECPALECPRAPTCPSPGPGLSRKVGGPSAQGEQESMRGSSMRRSTESVYSVAMGEAEQSALEVGLLMDARVAIDADQGFGALGHLDRHEQLFPRTNYLEERLALRIIASCLVKRRELAMPLWRELLERAPETTYAPRIHEHCGDLEPTPPPSSTSDDE